jgi:plasmid maintenance system antidote protein VapI
MSKNNFHTTAVHPGAVLLDELEEIGITQTALAGHIGVLPKTINETQQINRYKNFLSNPGG